MLLTDHSAKEALEDYLLEFERAKIWLSTFRHNIQCDQGVSLTDKQIILERADAIYKTFQKITDENELLHYFANVRSKK